MSIAMSEMSEIVIFETSMGVIEIEMDRENAPITVENFVKYASNGLSLIHISEPTRPY